VAFALPFEGRTWWPWCFTCADATSYGAELLTFVEFEGVPSSNSHAEREVRPAVLMRNASHGSQSERGAATRGILMSVCRTLKYRGLGPLQTVLNGQRTYATSGTLPPLPAKASSGG
jgi:hypothetical protein